MAAGGHGLRTSVTRSDVTFDLHSPRRVCVTWHVICCPRFTMISHAFRRIMMVAVLAGLAVVAWLWRPARATTRELPAQGVPRIHDNGQKFVACYGRLEKPLSVSDTWLALRGLRSKLSKLNEQRNVVGIIYYAGDDLYLAAADFQADQVFIDRIGERQAFTLIWHRVGGDFSPGWSLRAPDLIESTDPSESA